jgi:hypothetical protein
MALHGKFVIKNADYSPLTFPGVGTFLALSGNGAYRNRGGWLLAAFAKEQLSLLYF